MTKHEFLSTLRGRITGNIPTREVESQIDYYSAYIDGRIGAGLTEEEAVAELGDPQLIAKTVIESTDRAAEAAGYDGKYRSSTDTYDDSDGINSGIFGNSGPSSPGSASGSSYSGSPYGSSYQQRESTGSAQNSQYGSGQRSSDESGSTGSVGGGTGCIVAVIIFVVLMAIGWILTSFVFRLGIRLLGWLFPVIAVIAIMGLLLNLFRRR